MRRQHISRLLTSGLVIAAVALGGCSNKHNSPASSTPSTSPASSASPSSAPASSSAQAEIMRNWEKFFSGATSAQEKVSLLQNGAQFQQAIQAQAGSALAKSAGAKVRTVAVNAKVATVTYDVTLGGKAALANQQGQAVLEGGTWKVSDASFCQLLALENAGATSGLPPACGAASPGGPASPSS